MEGAVYGTVVGAVVVVLGAVVEDTFAAGANVNTHMTGLKNWSFDIVFAVALYVQASLNLYAPPVYVVPFALRLPPKYVHDPHV